VDTRVQKKKDKKLFPWHIVRMEDELLPVKTCYHGSGSLGLIKVTGELRELMLDAELGSGGTA